MTTTESSEAQMPDRRAVAARLISQVAEQCRELAGADDWWHRRLSTVDRYLAGEASWVQLESTVRQLCLVYLAHTKRRPDDEADALAKAVDALERLGKLLIATDDAYLWTALHDAAACLGWEEAATALATDAGPLLRGEPADELDP